jgi:hypothetical protein
MENDGASMNAISSANPRASPNARTYYDQFLDLHCRKCTVPNFCTPCKKLQLSTMFWEESKWLHKTKRGLQIKPVLRKGILHDWYQKQGITFAKGESLLGEFSLLKHPINVPNIKKLGLKSDFILCTSELIMFLHFESCARVPHDPHHSRPYKNWCNK